MNISLFTLLTKLKKQKKKNLRKIVKSHFHYDEKPHKWAF